VSAFARERLRADNRASLLYVPRADAPAGGEAEETVDRRSDGGDRRTRDDDRRAPDAGRTAEVSA
jgi:hypothetical protein